MRVADLTGWQLEHGDQIAPGLTAMQRLGGGAAYEAYLAFDDVLYAPVVVKLVRPDQCTTPPRCVGWSASATCSRRSTTR